MNIAHLMADGSSAQKVCHWSKPQIYLPCSTTNESEVQKIVNVTLELDKSFAERQSLDVLERLEMPTLRSTRQARVVGQYLMDELFLMHRIKKRLVPPATTSEGPPAYEPIKFIDNDHSQKLAVGCIADNHSIYAKRYSQWVRISTTDKNRLAAAIVLLGAMTPVWGWSRIFDEDTAIKDVGIAPLVYQSETSITSDIDLRQELLADESNRF